MDKSVGRKFTGEAKPLQRKVLSLTIHNLDKNLIVICGENVGKFKINIAFAG